MNDTPYIKPLSRKHRQRFFIFMVVIFVVVMPIFILYATGYRYENQSGNRSFVSIGGMYIGSDTEKTKLYVDDVEVIGVRLFRKASYVQNLTVGLHTVHVQGEGLYTWSKELPVYSQIVTEGNAFNLPRVPQIRPITKWIDINGNPVLFTKKGDLSPFISSSTTHPIVLAEKNATTTYSINAEYMYVSSLFSSTSIATSTSLNKVTHEVNNTFRFSSSFVSSASSSNATTSKRVGESKIYESNDDIYVSWLGGDSNRPYYYCIFYTTEASTTEIYGKHVIDQIHEQLDRGDRNSLLSISTKPEWLCRDTIKIDRKRQRVEWFNFLPNSTDHAILLLEDGLYVVEVDDRSWQNVQMLYGGDNLEVVLDGDRIYVRNDIGIYFELLTKIVN